MSLNSSTSTNPSSSVSYLRPGSKFPLRKPTSPEEKAEFENVPELDDETQKRILAQMILEHKREQQQRWQTWGIIGGLIALAITSLLWLLP